jgi:hypothetical protein
MNPTTPDEPDAVPITDPNDRRLYNEEGVDLTLVRWMLSLTPAERLQELQRRVDSFWRIRGDRSMR